MSTKISNTQEILEILQSQLAYIPGGRDCEGRPIIAITIPSELQPTTKPRLESVLEYFLSIFSEETKQRGLVLIVDARRGSWRVARSCIRFSSTYLGLRAASVIVVRPDGFWDKRVDNCTKSQKDREPKYITLARLPTYVEFAQLPYELGGNKAFNHADWIQTRMKVDEYRKEALDVVSKMSNLHQRLNSMDEIRSRKSDDDLDSYWESGMELTSAASRVLHSGRNLANSLSKESSQDMIDTVHHIHETLDSIELKQVDIENSWTQMERNLDSAREIDNLEEGVSQVTNWILGPADAMLNSCYQVGFDVTSAEELRRKHETLELECRETYGRYAELLHKIDNVSSDRLPEDLKSQRDFMDFVCRSFATRLERRRNVLITSQRFFRLVSEYFDKTSEVFDKLVMGNRTHDFSQAGMKLHKLEKSQSMLEALEREVVKEGEKLSDILSMPVKDALGRDVQVDYGEDIVNVRDILDATNARKNIFNDSVELQKLTLKQIVLIHTYERDAEQAVKWLNDLYDVLLEKHVEVGCNPGEIQSQKEQHQSFQETAKGTYDYGYQLVNGARVLRMSCRLSLDSNAILSSRLRQAWRQLRSVGQEQLTRLRVCAVFHRSVDEHCTRIGELIDAVDSLRRSGRNEEILCELRARAVIRDILGNREKLLLEVGRMVRLGRLLRTRLKEPLHQQRMSEAEDASAKESNLTAVEAISTRLAEVTRLAEKLDAKLCEAGARTRPVPVSAAALSTTLSTTTATFTCTNARLAQSPAVSPPTATTVTSSSISTFPTILSPSTVKSASPAIVRTATSSPLPHVSSKPTSPAPASDATQLQIASTREQSFALTTSVPSITTISSSTALKTSIPSLSTILSSPLHSTGIDVEAASKVQTPPFPSATPASAFMSSPLPIPHKMQSSPAGSPTPPFAPASASTPTVSQRVFSPVSTLAATVIDQREEDVRSMSTDAAFLDQRKQEMIRDGRKSREGSATEDSTYEGYVTATECSTTPTAPSRSDSFVTSPDCDEIVTVLPTTMSSSPSTWWKNDVSVIGPETIAHLKSNGVAYSMGEDSNKPKIPAQQKISETNGVSPIDRFVALERTVEERSGKIVKEVTETTTLRVSHDVRLDLASYKVTSNILQDHREDINVKEMQDIERCIIENDVKGNEETSGKHYEDRVNKSIAGNEEISTNTVYETSREEKSYDFSSEGKDVFVSLTKSCRRHEDSGIDMSPTQKDMQVDDFLERMKKVSFANEPLANGEKKLTNGESHSCNHKDACRT